MTAHPNLLQPQLAAPVSIRPVARRELLDAIAEDIHSHPLYDHGLHGCQSCGICEGTCPSARHHDFSPREIVQLLWSDDLAGIHDAMQEKIWACAECYICAARCPFENSPVELVQLLRDVAIRHAQPAAEEVFRPFSRVLLQVVSTGSQLPPIRPPNAGLPEGWSDVATLDVPLTVLRDALPRMPGHAAARPAQLRATLARYAVWEEAGGLTQLQRADPNLFDVLSDVIDEKRREWEEWRDDHGAKATDQHGYPSCAEGAA